MSLGTSELPNLSSNENTRACFKALYRYYIQVHGANRNVLAPYAAGDDHFSEILPLLISLESLEIIGESSKWQRRTFRLLYRGYRIHDYPSRRMLDSFSTSNVGSVWDDETGKKFLTKQLRDGADADDGVAPEYHPTVTVRGCRTSSASSCTSMSRDSTRTCSAGLDPQGAPGALRYQSYGSVPHWPRHD
ncbi:hypothetical protein EDB86DRAFT_223669 [Lactarius hatsudake]|nr:hypothetical protein EDB86DRAFT_223669 [Lactarius hatsudake]